MHNLDNIGLFVPPGHYGIAHLTEAVDDVEYKIQYALTDSMAVDAKAWGDIIKNGETLSLRPDTTPLLLNLPGCYRFIESSTEAGTISVATYPSHTFIKGDVK